MLPKKHTLNFKFKTMHTKIGQTFHTENNGNSTKPLLSSRLLKFRAFSNETKKMMDWDFIKSVNNLTKLISLNHVDVSEFIGLHDKNGKEIYEGDIYHMGDNTITYTVVWNDSGFIGKQNGSSSYAGLEYWMDRIEIIGNIYENKNLIN